MRTLLVLVAAVVIACATPTGGGTTARVSDATDATGKAGPHPEGDPAVLCGGECHEDEASEWMAGSHGVNNIRCLVCHGPANADLVAKPTVSACVSCHEKQVAANTSSARDCFACHDHHALSPHLSTMSATRSEGGVR